jgi:hypothetical protein
VSAFIVHVVTQPSSLFRVTICFAVLSGLEAVNEIKKLCQYQTILKQTQQTAECSNFFACISRFPSSFYSQATKHFEVDGFRWAPRSFIRHAIGDLSGHGHYPTTDAHAQLLTIEKDNVRRPGLYFSYTGFLIKIRSGERCARIIYLQVPYSWWETRQYICAFHQTSGARPGLNGLGRPAIVFKEIGNGAQGALGDITEDIEGRFFAK